MASQINIYSFFRYPN